MKNLILITLCLFTLRGNAQIVARGVPDSCLLLASTAQIVERDMYNKVRKIEINYWKFYLFTTISIDCDEFRLRDRHRKTITDSAEIYQYLDEINNSKQSMDTTGINTRATIDIYLDDKVYYLCLSHLLIGFNGKEYYLSRKLYNLIDEIGNTDIKNEN